MQTLWRQRVTIQAGGVVHVCSPELPEGAVAEVIVLIDNDESNREQQAALDKALMEAGLMIAPPEGNETNAYRAFQPISIQGKPISETILEERR